jgi:DNA repair protein RadC
MEIKLTAADKKVIKTSESLYPIMQKIFLREQEIDRNREHFWVVGLDTKMRLLFIELVSLGTVNKSLVEPMEVFSFALQKRAVGIIAVHNHPSGDLIPSKSDKDTTDRLIQSGRLVNCHLVDHLIITETTYVSFADLGIMAELGKSDKYFVSDEPYYHQKKMLRQQEEMILIEKEKMALELKKAGVLDEIITKATGLSKAKIKKL